MSEKVVPGQIEGTDLQSLFDSLKHVCDTLENGGLTLEESVAVFAQGAALETRIKAELGRAERRIVEIIGTDGVISNFDIAKDGSAIRGPR